MRGRRLSPMMAMQRHPPTGCCTIETEAGLALYRASSPLHRLNRDMHCSQAVVRRAARRS